jgi:hypothetical protein
MVDILRGYQHTFHTGSDSLIELAPKQADLARADVGEQPMMAGDSLRQAPCGWIQHAAIEQALARRREDRL